MPSVLVALLCCIIPGMWSGQKLFLQFCSSQHVTYWYGVVICCHAGSDTGAAMSAHRSHLTLGADGAGSVHCTSNINDLCNRAC